MVESENTFAHIEATREYIGQHGKRVAFYSDKHSVFRNTNASALGDGMTQFGRAVDALNIEIICANRCRPRAGLSGRTGRSRTAWSRR